ncbi:MAG: acyl-CoA dehydrogenase [Frondihabitans sp.]|nr:acyl-CoA dehydrogenase [Frondihabitans sp.]
MTVTTQAQTRDELIDRFAPVFDRIAEGAVDRERSRILPFEQVRWLVDAGFTAVTVPIEDGGGGASPSDLFALLIRLGEADSNLPQLLRAHFSFVEDLLLDPGANSRQRWLGLVAAGKVFGNASHERSAAKVGSLSTRIEPEGDGWRLDGEKHYSTGTLFSDWTTVSAETPDGRVAGITVEVDAAGLDARDDWNGFGQRLTGSGTTRLTGVHVESENIRAERAPGRPTLLPSFLQSVLLASLAGVARATARDAADFVRTRTRVYGHSVAATAAADPLVQSVVGRISAAAVAAEALVLDATAAIDRAHVGIVSGADTATVDSLIEAAELRTIQVQLTVVDLTLQATTTLFEVGGASATDRDRALDRHWRNARTLSSHNPAIFQQRVIGDHVINGTDLTYFWSTGEAR